MSVQTAFRLDDDIFRALKDISKDGRPMKWHVQKALSVYLGNQKSPTESPPQGRPPSRPRSPPKSPGKIDYKQADELIGYINELSSRNFRCTKTNREGIQARLKDYSYNDCRLAIGHMWSRWSGDQKMEQHFNPVTLFRASNFDKYLNAGYKPAPERKKSLMERMNDKARENITQSVGANGGAFQLPMD